MSIDSWRPPVVNPNPDGTRGWRRSGPITLPASVSEPGAVLIRTDRDKHGHATVEYIGTIELASSTQIVGLTANSWVSSDQGWRTFFIGGAFLPKDTPEAMLKLRKEELEKLQGDRTTRKEKRLPSDRIYWYQRYDDLSAPGKPRPQLGLDDAGEGLPYPRRLATNRGLEPGSDDREIPPADGESMWVPFDEQFSAHKASDFSSTAVKANTARFYARYILLFGRPFRDFNSVLSVFKDDSGKQASPLSDNDIDAFEAFRAWDLLNTAEDSAAIYQAMMADRMGSSASRAAGLPPTPGLLAAISEDEAEDTDRAFFTNMAADGLRSMGIIKEPRFPVPKVLAGRLDAWDSDEEMGRQALAGMNPVTLKALFKTPEDQGSAIRDVHINEDEDLQGATLASLVADAKAGNKPRLYWIDHWALGECWSEAGKAQNEEGKRVQHAGRALFYLRKDPENGDRDAGLVPIAIELAHPNTHPMKEGTRETHGEVYSRSQLKGDKRVVWTLAKAVFRSLDASVHQLDSHFNRSHAMLEPFLIAMRRNISCMHPVFKLMLPHFRYTLDINRNARSNLVNAPRGGLLGGGIIEQAFSAGEYAMRLAAKLYGATWTFAGQALPKDLERRNILLKKDEKGKLMKPYKLRWLHYPYAEDGLLIWEELEKYFDEYLRLYFKSDDAVAGDKELQAWWAEVKAEGHPDAKLSGRDEEQVWGFEGPIPSIDELVQILVTIAYMASAHHAAVNFGQYDYSALILNNSSLIRRHMPVKGTPAWDELVGARGNAQEKVFMSYLVDSESAFAVMSIIRLLSSHAPDEQTLEELNEYLVDKPAVEANARFAAAMKVVEDTIKKSNADPAMWARYGLEPPANGGASPLPYTLLMPSSGSGITMRGVPYSVSI
ncbi:hypothetical protein HYH03_010384 [Edaphochlamys debaryana]|uniref:Lipoxygenase n=1 Tax=Edaphochlamys debaryana TaxID=47281 RepID=A0A836BWN8_9CHLO|nr:hypothetical protein HYH03_010384 [Edaphochlamys debaryana]|eukprot:KAG2491172.1 hypothetical protein HYH03_010384 [Edaphochlamys debaryana]